MAAPRLHYSESFNVPHSWVLEGNISCFIQKASFAPGTLQSRHVGMLVFYALTGPYSALGLYVGIFQNKNQGEF